MLIIKIIFLFCLIRTKYAKLNCDCQPNIGNRIINGIYTEKHEFPWQISLGYENKKNISHICGGTIINSNWILTAAHCVVDYKNESLYKIGYGTNDLEEMLESNRITAKKIVIHFNYNKRDVSSIGDIALIELTKPLNLSLNIKPGCFKKNLKQLNFLIDNKINLDAIATGWGSVTRTHKFIIGSLKGAKIDRHLKKANFKVKNTNETHACKYRTDLICVDPIKDRSDSVCNGDSGGPLHYIFEEDSTNYLSNKMVIIGITSFVTGEFSWPLPIIIKFCNGPAAFTKITHYLDFIQNNVKDNLCLI